MSDAPPETTPEIVARWFEECTVRRTDPVPTADSPHVAGIARFINETREIVFSEIRKDEIRQLEEFYRLYTKLYDKSSEMVNLLQEITPLSENMFGTESPFVKKLYEHRRDIIKDLLSTTPNNISREPWYAWAWDLYQLAKLAWVDAGWTKEPKINKNNPMSRLLIKALSAIDGENRSPENVEKAIARHGERVASQERTFASQVETLQKADQFVVSLHYK